MKVTFNGKKEEYKMTLTKEEFKAAHNNIMKVMENHIMMLAHCDRKTANLVANEILDLEDDAAHVNMCGKWRMPTSDEFKELVDNTTYEVETINGVKGMMFTSNINKHQMFIPFMQGCWYNGNLEKWNRSLAYIWSSQVHASYIDTAYRLYFSSYGNANVIGLDSCSTAFSIRGVFRK